MVKSSWSTPREPASRRSDLTNRRKTISALSGTVTGLRNREILAGVVVEGHHLAALDLVDPCMQPQLAARQRRQHRRMRAQILDLNEHILFDAGFEFLVLGQILVVRLITRRVASA